MPAKPEPHRIFPDNNGKAVIICPQCMKRRPIDAASHLESHKTLKVGCGCGHTFRIVFDTRDFYRKGLRLPGQYTKLPTDNPEFLTVENLSYTGVRFRTRFLHNIEVDDVLTIDFVLDNQRRTRIVKTVRVMYVAGRLIGAEFRDRQAYSTELTYYLNPS